MKTFRIEQFTKGWFVGGFEPTAYKTTDVEVAVKHYKKGDFESAHYHKVATELTCVVSGEVEMCGQIFKAGDIVMLSPGEASSFKALTDSVNVVVKLPGAMNDKFILDQKDTAGR